MNRIKLNHHFLTPLSASLRFLTVLVGYLKVSFQKAAKEQNSISLQQSRAVPVDSS